MSLVSLQYMFMIVGVNEKTKSGLLIEHRFFAKSIYNRFFVIFYWRPLENHKIFDFFLYW